MSKRLERSSLFLQSATLGANEPLIKKVARHGVEVWLEEQLSAQLSVRDTFQSETQDIWAEFRSKLLSRHGERALNGEGNNPALPYKYYFRMAWWQKVLSTKVNDLTHVRHRVAQALSEILVISDNSILELDAIGMASYYDILYRHAFGKYSDLLEEVTMHPCMGVYLSHMNNQKADPKRNIHPDENYAREIMQLFTIGLYELNMDGTRTKGDVPSYDNNDIRELARVFTGLKASEYRYEWPGEFFPYNGEKIHFDDSIDKTNKMPPFVNMVEPMNVDEAYHDAGEKTLLKGHIKVKAGQKGSAEIHDVVRQLVAHPNTAPFIAKKLIQQLVTSNPSKDYVMDVASKFGRFGDLKAVVRQVLLHPEALKPQKLKSPLLRVTQILKAFDVTNDSGKLWVTGDYIQDSLNQHPLSSPTVFNFYKPDFVPHGPIERADLVAPEFELQNASTSVAYINTMYAWVMGGYLPLVSTEISASESNIAELDADTLYRNQADRLRFDFGDLLRMADSPGRHEDLIDRVSIILTGKMNLPVKRDILKAFRYYNDNPLWVVQTIIFLVSVSADYTVLEA